MPTSTTRVAYRPDEAARLLSISRALIYRMIKEGKIRSVKIGQARLIPASEIRRVGGELVDQ